MSSAHPAIYCINLARSEERRNNMLKTLPVAFQNDFHFFEAVDAHIPEALAEWRSRDDHLLTWMWNGRRLADTEIACYASHYRCWEKCIELNEPIIVCEDDITFSPNFENGIVQIQKRNLEYVKLYVISSKRLKKIDAHFSQAVGNTTGTQAYYLTPDAAKKFILTAKKWTEAVDVYLDQYWKHGVVSLVSTPFLLEENECSKESTIGERRAARATFFYRITKELVRIYYQFCAFLWRSANKTQWKR